MNKREFRLKRKGETLTPETLMRILTQTAGEETAREVYKDLTGKEPPEGGMNENSTGDNQSYRDTQESASV